MIMIVFDIILQEHLVYVFRTSSLVSSCSDTRPFSSFFFLFYISRKESIRASKPPACVLLSHEADVFICVAGLDYHVEGLVL